MTDKFKCGQCGTWINFGTQQCPQCGRTFLYADTTPPQLSTPTQPTLSSTTGNRVGGTAPKAPKKNTKLLAIVAAAIVLALLLLLLIPGKKQEQDNQDVYGLTENNSDSLLYDAMEPTDLESFDDDKAAKEEKSIFDVSFIKKKAPAQPQVVIDGEGVRLRFEPSLEAGYLIWEDGRTRSVPKGTKLEYISETKDWYCVRYKDKKFYVSKQFSYLDTKK